MRSKNFLLAADHDCQITRRRTALAAAHRGVQHVRTLGAKPGFDLAYQRRPAGRQVHVDTALADALQHAAIPQSHRFHLSRSGQRREHHVAETGNLGRRARLPRPGFHKWLRRGLPNIVHHQRVVRLLDVRRHAHAHVAQSDESYRFHVFLPGVLNCRRSTVLRDFRLGSPDTFYY